MLRRRFDSDQKAQIFIEYTIVVGVIVLVILAMGMAIKRGTQAMVKSVADEIGIQKDADQRFDDTGHLESSFTTTRSSMDKIKSEFVGDTRYRYNDVVKTTVQTSINLGFTEEN